jgi:hypothetical protein
LPRSSSTAVMLPKRLTSSSTACLIKWCEYNLYVHDTS